MQTLPPSAVEVRLDDEWLRSRFNGQRYCSEDALTRDILLAFLRQRGDIKTVKTYTVSVQNLTGDQFEIKLDKTRNSVGVLKTEIEKMTGTECRSQELYLSSAAEEAKNPRESKGEEIGTNTDGDCNRSLYLQDHILIQNKCTVVLVQAATTGRKFYLLFPLPP